MKFNDQVAAGLQVDSDYMADLPPGIYDGICVDVEEHLNAERKRWQSTETERVNLLAFTFEVTGKSGAKRSVRSKRMLISSFEGSALFKFVTAWCGQPPESGFDTDSLMGCRANLTLTHAPSTTLPSRVYVRIATIAPVADTGKGGAL